MVLSSTPVDPPVLPKYYYTTNIDIENSIQDGKNIKNNDTNLGYLKFPGYHYNELTIYERNLTFDYRLNGNDLALNRVATYTDINNSQSIVIAPQYNHISFFIKTAGGGGGGGGGGQYNNNDDNNNGGKIPSGGSGGGGGGGSRFIYKLPIYVNDRQITFIIGTGGAGGAGGTNTNGNDSYPGVNGVSGNNTTITHSIFYCKYDGGNGGNGGKGAFVGTVNVDGGTAGTDGTFNIQSNNIVNYNTLTGNVSGGGSGKFVNNTSNRSNYQPPAAIGDGFKIDNLSSYINNIYNPINTKCGGNGGVGASTFTNDIGLSGKSGVTGQNAMVRVYFHIN